MYILFTSANLQRNIDIRNLTVDLRIFQFMVMMDVLSPVVDKKFFLKKLYNFLYDLYGHPLA